MIRFEKSLQAWGTADFNGVLKQEIAHLGSDQLPLHKSLSSSNHVADEPLTVMIISVVEQNDVILVQAGIFFKGVLGGCSCADDPGPPGESNEYCEVQLELDKATAATRITLVSE